MSNSLLQPKDRTTTDFGISAAVENYFDLIIELFHDEIDDNGEQLFSIHDYQSSLLNAVRDRIQSGEKKL